MLDTAFENHRQDLASKTAAVQKEEAQLTALLGADTIDRNAILSEIDRVVQARGDLERTNSAMTLEMREALTRAQWMQVPQAPTIRFMPAQSGPVQAPFGPVGGSVRGGPAPK